MTNYNEIGIAVMTTARNAGQAVARGLTTAQMRNGKWTVVNATKWENGQIEIGKRATRQSWQSESGAARWAWAELN